MAAGAAKGTGLVPSADQAEPQSSGPVSLVTELYYQCHRAIHVGSQVCQDTVSKLRHDLARPQRLLQDAESQFTQQDPFLTELRNNSQKKLCLYLSYQMVLLEPVSRELRTRFHVATTTWILQHATPCDPPTFPLPPPDHPHHLANIPEYFLENISDHVVFLKLHDLKSLEVIL
ncbi:UBE4A [Cordylochernes scorpioides]|uniref:RING-type E3 ubiquitin transferase n=1 Tax=Cordylochernes scorpioides TaxID=51811 RepID=A0ABY6KRB8_9ARAC|nr:UBE4A [Cordylochernes scorpioides]